MKNKIFAMLAVAGVMLGSLTFAPAANAVYAPNGHGYSWQENPNG